MMIMLQIEKVSERTERSPLVEMTMTSIERHANRAESLTSTFRIPSMATIAAIMALIAGPAKEAHAGRPSCAPQKKVADHLGERFSEAPVGIGLTANGHVMQVYSTADGESWTLVSTTPQGVSCILAAGRHWQPLEPELTSKEPAA